MHCVRMEKKSQSNWPPPSPSSTDNPQPTPFDWYRPPSAATTAQSSTVPPTTAQPSTPPHTKLPPSPFDWPTPTSQGWTPSSTTSWLQATGQARDVAAATSQGLPSDRAPFSWPQSIDPRIKVRLPSMARHAIDTVHMDTGRLSSGWDFGQQPQSQQHWIDRAVESFHRPPNYGTELPLDATMPGDSGYNMVMASVNEVLG